MLRGPHLRLVDNALPVVEVDYQNMTAYQSRLLTGGQYAERIRQIAPSLNRSLRARGAEREVPYANESGIPFIKTR